MIKFNCRAALTLILLLALNTLLLGDVTKKSTTKMEFKGAAGTMMKFLGVGKPSHTAEYLKGNTLRIDEFDDKGKKVEQSRIVNLDEEVFIMLNHKKKRYSRMTFEEFNQMMQENLEKLKGMGSSEDNNNKSDVDVEWDFDVDVSNTGETRDIAGHNTEEMVMTMKIEAEATEKNENQEGDPQKAKGGMVVKSTHWMAKNLGGDDEYRDFYLKLTEKLGFDMKSGMTGNVLGSIMQNYPQLASAMEKMKEESKELEGTALETRTVYETWGESSSQQQNQQPKMKMPSLGGLFGKKEKEEPKDDDAGPNALMESSTVVTEYNTNPISSDLLEIPANYKEEKPNF